MAITEDKIAGLMDAVRDYIDERLRRASSKTVLRATDLGVISRGLAPALGEYVTLRLAPVVERVAAMESKSIAAVPVEAIQILSDRIKQLENRPAGLRYRGTWTDGELYRTGDVTTWGGAMFCALEDTTAKPGLPTTASRSWQLCVKAGRDGKDGRA